MNVDNEHESGKNFFLSEETTFRDKYVEFYLVEPNCNCNLKPIVIYTSGFQCYS